jgi:hypothetical protein
MRAPSWKTSGVVAGAGDEVMIGKGNHPQLPHEIRLVFHESPALAETMPACDTVDHGHGRRAARRLTASPALMAYSNWPGLAQVFHIARRVTVKQSEAQSAAVVYGVTNLSPERARPARLLRLVRQHWQIANQAPWVRDVTFDEDRSQVRCGSIPQVTPCGATPPLACCTGQARRISPRPVAALQPSLGWHEP